MGKTELHQRIRAERAAQKREVIKTLRYLTSCSAEAMSDYRRINALVKWGHDAAVLLEHED